MTQLGQEKIFSLLTMRIVASIGSCLITCAAIANPVLNNVAAGNVSIHQSPTTTVVNQASQQAIINWRSFNIGPQEATHFMQPAGGIALNRISATQGASQIYGILTATSQIILINPAGIYFGPSAHINVGGMIATTENITDQNFLNGNYQFASVPGYSGSIINQGQIIAANHGLIALVGSGVENDGEIQANLGHVILASGGAFTISFPGTNLINFAITAPTSQPGVDENGHPLNNGVSNTGSIIANGGQILVTAEAAQGVLNNVINMQGVAQAQSVSEQNGEIILSGEQNGVVNVSGTLDASGKGANETGGNIEISGNDILINSPSLIDASGYAGGGNIYIGGNQQSSGPQFAITNSTVLMPGVTLLANSLVSGNGGYIETSGHYLDINGINVNTTAPNGNMGTWLLDPTNVTISSAADSNTTNGSSIYQPTNGALASSNINVTNLENDLATTNVTVTTTPVSGSGGGGSGNITVSAPITWTATSTLFLNAVNNIIINAAITALNGSLSLNAANQAQSITTSAAGAIDVKNFNITQGRWFQDSASLPAFTVTNNFQLNSGSLPSSNVEFIRALGGTGTTTNPYILTDIYGVQGIGSDATTLADSYELGNNIDATITQNWNSGQGFVPIGDSSTAFTGNFNGQNFIINNLFINNSTSSQVGLFGEVNPPSASLGNISNLGITNANITSTAATADVGILAGELIYNNTPEPPVTNVYTTGTVTTTGSDVNVGGLAGYITSFDLFNDYSKAIVTSNVPNGGTANIGGLVGDLTIFSFSIDTSFSAGQVIANTTGSPSHINIGGLIGLNDGDLSNDFSYDSVTQNTISGTPAAGSIYAGGFVGDNTGATASIANSYSTGDVSIAAAGSLIGGFGASNDGGGVISNSFWDTDTSGQSTGVASNSSTITNLVGGCFTGTCTNGGTANLSSQATFTGAGWDFSTNWGIIAGQSYPYLLGIFTSTPRAISGTAASVGGNETVKLASAGSIIDSVQTGANSFFYFLEQNGAISDAASFITYLSGAATKANAVAIAPASGGSLTDLSMVANTVKVGENIDPSTISNALLSSALGSLVDPNILYSTSGNNITIASGDAFLTTAPTTFNLNGNINTTSASMTFNGPVTQSTNAVLTNTTSGAVTLNSTDNGGDNSLTITSPGASSIAGILSNLSALNMDGTGSLTLSAANTYSGATNINSGTLINGITNAIGNSNVTVASGATWNVNNFSDTIGSLAGAGDVSLGSAALNVGGDNASTNFSAAISGTGSLTKSGTGTFTLSGSNSYTGATNVDAGVLDVASANALGNATLHTSGVSVSSGSTLSLSNITLTPTLALTLNGSGISSTGALLDVGTSDWNGNITLGSAATIGTSLASDVLTLNGTINGANALSLAGPGNITLAGTIGNTVAPTSLLSNVASTIIATADITTNGNQTYNDPVTLTTSPTLKSGSGTITFNSTLNGAGQTLSLQDSTAGSTGNVIFNGDLTLAGLNSFGGASHYAISLLGSSNTFTNAVTFNNTNGVTLGNSSNDVFHFVGGLTDTVGTINVGGNINSINTPITLGTIVLNSNSAINSGSGAIAIGAASGATSLSLTSTTGSTLNGAVNIGDLTLSGGGNDVINTPSITTSGTQLYNDLVSLNQSSTLTGSTVTFANGINGNLNLNIAANLASITGTLALDNISITGNSTNNTFDLNTLGTQNWFITGNNSGNLSDISTVTGNFTFNNVENIGGGSATDNFALTGGSLSGDINGGGGNNTLTAGNVANTWNIIGTNAGSVTNISGFNNIQNLIGGNSSNTFIFANDANITGLVNGNSSASNTLDYLAYIAPIHVTLTPGIFQGDTLNNAGNIITSFTNINNLIGNSSTVNILTLPDKHNTLTINGPLQGSISDPLTFNGFTILISSSGIDTLAFNVPVMIDPANDTVVIDGITMTFINFNLNESTGATETSEAPIAQSLFNVYAIIQQPDVNSIDTGDSWLLEAELADQLSDTINAFNHHYDIHSVKINPYCDSFTQ